MGKTTNWQNEDEFHPSVLLSALTGWTLPPYNRIGLMELFTYVLQGKRSSEADDQGHIADFECKAGLMAVLCLPSLNAQFPQLATYAAEISKILTTDYFSSSLHISDWISLVETKFGRTVRVKAMEQPIPNVVDVEGLLKAQPPALVQAKEMSSFLNKSPGPDVKSHKMALSNKAMRAAL